MAKKKSGRSPRRIQAVLDMVNAIKGALGDHSPYIRRQAWKDLTGKKGTKAMNQIFRNPRRSLNQFRTLWSEGFKEWLQNND